MLRRRLHQPAGRMHVAHPLQESVSFSRVYRSFVSLRRENHYRHDVLGVIVIEKSSSCFSRRVAPEKQMTRVF
jgi:hypothetical protein